MVKPTADSLRTAGGLTENFVLCDPCLSDEEFNALRHQEFSAKERHILLGQLGDNVAGLMERGAAASGGNTKRAEARKAQERRTAQITEIIEQTRTAIERMAAEIKALEDAFSARDEAWRENLALEILDENKIPQRKPDESMEDYRERLEKHLIEEMLNPDGTIKDKYKDDPKYSDYAEWAQKQNNLNNAKALTAELEDEGTSPERQEEILNAMRERGHMEEMMQADRESQKLDTQASLRDTRDSSHDATAHQDQTSEMNAFLKLNA